MRLISISGEREVLGADAAVKLLLQKFNEDNRAAPASKPSAAQSIESRLHLWQLLYHDMTFRKWRNQTLKRS